MARRTWRRITPDQRREIYRMAAKGASYAEIARHFGRWEGAIRAILQPLGGVIRRELWQLSNARLSVEERVEVRLGIERGESFECIGQRIGRHRSTVCREVNNNGGRSAYRPTVAHRAAWERARRPKTTKLASSPALCARVIADLEALWSPQQIAATLKRVYPGQRERHVSHETIYTTIYAHPKGELRRELIALLRRRRRTTSKSSITSWRTSICQSGF